VQELLRYGVDNATEEEFVFPPVEQAEQTVSAVL
jgi:hypothetical protein